MSRAVSRAALGGAALWGVALVVAAFTLPAYTGEEGTASSDGTMHGHRTTATLVEVNGSWGAVLAAAPVLAAILVTALLTVRHRDAAHGGLPRVAAWTVVAALALLALAGLLTIGLFFVPAVAALALAVAAAPGSQRTPPREPAP